MNEEKIDEFLNSYDFLRLGQAISQGNQSAAMMIIGHLQRLAAEADVMDIFGMNFDSIRHCIIGNESKQAQDILAIVTAKRVKMIEERKS